MQIRAYRRWLTAAALAITPVLAPRFASAQYLSQNNSGHALDANAQVGSGGINGTVNSGSLVTNNDIVFGNVTGGRGFHGKVDSFGSDSFQGGTLAGANTDAFVAGSSGAPTPYSPTFNNYTPRPFYGQSRGVNPPPGTILLGSSGAAIGTSLTPANPYSANPDQLEDIRVGTTNVIGYSGDNTNFLAVPGSANSSLPNIQAALTGSPLYGPNLVATNGQLTATGLNESLTNPMPGTLAPGSLDPNSLAALRATISTASPTGINSPDVNNPNDSGADNQNSQNSSQVNPYNPASGNPLLPPSGGNGSEINGAINNSPLQMPAGSSLGTSRVNDSVQSAPLGTYSESANGLQLVSPGAYSNQYGEMSRLLKRYNVQSPTRTSANRPRPKIGTPTTQPGQFPLPGTTPPGSNPGTTPESIPGTTPPGTPTGAVPPGPLALPGGGEQTAGVKISSIAGTVTSRRAKGLHDLLARGDEALKNDQLKDALGVYEGAAKVAPNNQMITLGLANADLAGGYYAAAETNVRRAFANDANVLMAKQDLASMISASRLDFVKNDLKELADKNPKLSRPWFLLAYINYNTGHEQAAADDLKQAQKLSGAADTGIQLMQMYWQLPAANDLPDLNK